MALHAILPGELLFAVWTGDFVLLVDGLDMSFAVFCVPEALVALRTLFLARPRFVVGATMFSARYVLAVGVLGNECGFATYFRALSFLQTVLHFFRVSRSTCVHGNF
jgi:hypothetical protein